MGENAKPKRTRTNMRNMTEEQKSEHIRQRSIKHAKNWRDKHPDFFTTRVSCECGGSYTKQNKTSHENTQKHKQLLAIAQMAKKLNQLQV